VTAITIPTTPVTALPPEPWIPGTPSDPEAKVAYEEVKQDVNKMALQLCASRYALRRSFNSDYDVIHPTMVRPKDTLLAAQVSLDSLKLPLPLSTYIDALLPPKLESYADDEAAGAKQYSIQCREQLDDVDNWLQFDERTGELTTILEAQRDLLKMNKDRRKSRELAVGEKGIKLAWAVKLVDDSQYFADVAADGDSEGSDEGYEYGNFVRSLGEDGSSLRSNGSMLDLTMISTNSSYARSSGMDESFDVAQRSASSPIRPTHSSSYENLPLRSRNYTLSNLSNAVDLEFCAPSTSHAHGIRRSNATATASRRDQYGNLSINTSLARPSLSSPSTMSPQERGTRHKGPSIEDLSSWADELKRMERKRAEMRLDGGFGGPRGGRARQERWFSVDEGGDDGEGYNGEDGDAETVIKEEQEADEDGDGLMINGFVHPALRGGGHRDGDDDIANPRDDQITIRGESGKRDASGGTASIRSWRCSTASSIEQSGHPSSVVALNDDDNNNKQTSHDEVTITGFNDDSFPEEDHDTDADSPDSATTPIPSTMPTPDPFSLILPKHPLRSSSSPTHPPIKLSELSNLRRELPRQQPVLATTPSSPRLAPPRPPPPSSTLSPLSTTPSSLHLTPPRPPPVVTPAVDVLRYNRAGATSFERQSSRPPNPTFPSMSIDMTKRQQTEQGSQQGMHQRGGGGSKAMLLQEALRMRGAQHTHTHGRTESQGGRGAVKSKGEEEWDEELKRMEGRERMRQLGRGGGC
jgi:hypothetical protein